MSIVARLSALLTADSTRFESTLNRANSAMGRARSSWNNDLNRAGRSFSQFDTHIRRSLGSITDLKTQLGGIATVAASALSVQKIIQYSDTWKQLEGQLRVATRSSEEMANAQDRLFKVAQRNAAPLKDVTDAYSKMSLALNDTQKQQFDLIQITDLLSKTLKVSGTNAAGAATFFQQFGQAASSDFKAIGQEIQTFQDQNAFFAKVLKENIDLGGRSLKKFAEDGELSFAVVAQALIKGAADINKAAESIPVTVGRAMQKLDNAFLRFIGQTEAIRAGTGSLALGINFMAENFDTLATAAAGVAAVIGARLVGSLGMAAISFVSATASAYAYQLALARMAGLSATAATATLGLGAALGTMGGAIALLGGPLGVAFLGTLGIMMLRTHQAGEAQRVMNQRLAEHREAVQGFIFASKERRKEIEDATRQNIQNLKKELEAVVVLFEAYQSKSFAGRFLQNLGGNIGIGKGVKDIVNEGAALEKALAELEGNLATFENFKGGSLDLGTGSGTGASDKEQKKVDDIIRGLKEESEQIALQTKLYGQKESAIERAQQALKIQQQLAQAGVQLSKDQQAEIETYLDSIERQNELQKTQAEQQKRLEEQERNRKQAIDQLGASFESAFENAIVEGKKLSDVLDGLGNDILRLLTRMTITQPLVDGITDIFSSSGSGGGIGGFIGDLFGFQSFATGIDYVPNDTYAKLHRGEAVMKASELQNLRGGSGEVMVVINNNAGAAVSQSSRDTGNGTELTIQLDRAVADNIARPGSATNQALKAYSSRNLVKR